MRQHYRHGRVAYDAAGASANVAWFGDSRIFQRCAGNVCDRVIVPEGETEGEIITPRFGDIAANAVRAGRYTWHSRLDEPRSGPTLRFSTGPETLPGFEGAVAANADVSVVLALDKRLVRVIKGGITVRTVQLPGGVFGDPWIDSTGTWLVASCFRDDDTLQLALVNLQTGTVMADPVCLTKANHYAAACVALGPDAEDVYVAYFTDEFGLVIHPAYDPTRRRLLSPRGAGVWGTDLCILEDAPNAVSIVWANTGERGYGPERRESITIEDLRALPSVPVPAPVVEPPAPPAQPIGPLGPSLPAGTVTNAVAAVFDFDPKSFPRGVRAKGDSHELDIIVTGDQATIMKFARAKNYEIAARTPWGVDHLEDASNDAFTQTFTLTHWWPKEMKVGYEHAYRTGPHEAIFMDRAGCRVTARVPFAEEMWCLASWPKFWCGPDLGVCHVDCYVYDPTDGVHSSPDGIRGIELFFYARGFSWFLWHYHDAAKVWASGRPVFDVLGRGTIVIEKDGREARSLFCRIGGTRVLPQYTTCQTTPTIDQPPVDPPAPPRVDPPPPPPIDPPAPPVEPPPLPPALTGEAGYTQAAEEAAARLLRDAREGK